MSAVLLRCTLTFALLLPLLTPVSGLAVPGEPGAPITVRLAPLPPDDPASVTGGPDLVPRYSERAAASLMVPLFVVDRANPVGTTTLYAVRNTSASATHRVAVSYWVDWAFDPQAEPDLVQTFDLAPRQVRTVNLRDVRALSGGAGGDQEIRGWMVARQVTGGPGAISGDWFRVTPGQDFATGGRMVDASTSPYTCTKWDVRFLVGGAFSGGTRLEVFVDTPLGAHPGSNPPSFTVAFATEAGTLHGTALEVFTDRQALELDVAALRAMLPTPRPSFGAMEIVFRPGTNGGLVTGSYSAEGRYSVGMNGTCLVP